MAVDMAALKLQTTVAVMTILVGAVFGQCPAVRNCFNNLGIDTDSALNSLQLEGVMDANLTSQAFDVICQNTHQLVSCAALLPLCPGMNGMASSILPPPTQIGQYLALLCQNKDVYIRGNACMSSGTIAIDLQACASHNQNGMSGMTLAEMANIQQIICRAYDGIITCLTTTPSFQRCGSDFRTLLTKSIGYLKPAGCTQDYSGGHRVTACLFLAIVMAFLISTISVLF